MVLIQAVVMQTSDDVIKKLVLNSIAHIPAVSIAGVHTGWVAICVSNFDWLEPSMFIIYHEMEMRIGITKVFLNFKPSADPTEVIFIHWLRIIMMVVLKVYFRYHGVRWNCKLCSANARLFQKSHRYILMMDLTYMWQLNVPRLFGGRYGTMKVGINMVTITVVFLSVMLKVVYVAT